MILNEFVTNLLLLSESFFWYQVQHIGGLVRLYGGIGKRERYIP